MKIVRALPLLALTLAVVLVISRPRRASADAARSVRLMTYNLNFGNPDHDATIEAIAKEDADIVLLQEITRDWRGQLEEQLATQYPHQTFRLHARAAGGLAILSKHPIRSEDLWAPPRGGWFPASRVIVDGPFGALQLLNLHLRPCVDRGSWLRGYLTTPPIRKREIEAYWKKVRGDLPTIVAGDFNEDPGGRAIAYLANHGLTRIAPQGPSTWHYRTWTGGKLVTVLSLDLDHVMIDRRLTSSDARVVDAGTSDHRPVVVTVRPR